MKYIVLKNFLLFNLLIFTCFFVSAGENWQFYQMIENNIWFVVAVIVLIIEIGTGGIGLFFVTIGAFFTGIFLSGNYINPELSYQLSCFFSLTCLSAAILWKPFRAFHGKKSDYNSIIKGKAIVDSKMLNKHLVGSVKWSGTVVNAMLDTSCHEDEIPKGTEVEIVRTEGNVFYVTTVTAKSSDS